MGAADSERRRTGCRPIIEDKWSLTVLSFLTSGPRRFVELRRGIDGVSQRMLTVTLRSLERSGVVLRTVHNVMPPHVSYELTPMGVTLVEALTPMMQWAQSNLELVEEAHTAYDARTDSSPE